MEKVTTNHYSSTRFWRKDLDWDLNNWRDSNLNIWCNIVSLSLSFCGLVQLQKYSVFIAKFCRNWQCQCFGRPFCAIALFIPYFSILRRWYFPSAVWFCRDTFTFSFFFLTMCHTSLHVKPKKRVVNSSRKS